MMTVIKSLVNSLKHISQAPMPNNALFNPTSCWNLKTLWTEAPVIVFKESIIHTLHPTAPRS